MLPTGAAGSIYNSWEMAMLRQSILPILAFCLPSPLPQCQSRRSLTIVSPDPALIIFLLDQYKISTWEGNITWKWEFASVNLLGSG